MMYPQQWLVQIDGFTDITSRRAGASCGAGGGAGGGAVAVAIGVFLYTVDDDNDALDHCV